ncbi:MAG TPA: LacI family DNA-binding transcriptional regulator [Povalibacter sp.]|uniref:LacI family DNA-binding transcriptional regulator n=1 Tax=Povalibacter sp. TaxID=1962978 RepID=UPI002BE4FBDC|nr:LacI family DNA-binding transcriptional regulator [Povalibacter sp.]HMN46618.1 LacI family DNA-binding transcriptional regulator [Povalibacter sp.]
MSARPAIGTVAAEARVSIKTVSRVINNSDRVTQATRDHVMSVIRRLGYSPSSNARRLAGHRSLLVGLPFDNPYASYVTEVQGGALARFRAANYQVVSHACDSRSPSLGEDIRRFVSSVRVDGVILTPPLSDAHAVIDALTEDGIPFVRMAPASRSDPARSVFANDRESACAMTRQLALLGHRRIGFVAGDPRHSGTAQRHEGYCDGLRAAGLPCDDRWVVAGDGSFEAGIAAARRLLRLPRALRPTAIFCSSDRMAAGALHVAHEKGIAVPTQLSIAGCGDEPLASQVWPRLSTISLPLYGLARQAATLLVAQLQPESAPVALDPVASSLILRQSTGPAPDRRA